MAKITNSSAPAPQGQKEWPDGDYKVVSIEYFGKSVVEGKPQWQLNKHGQPYIMANLQQATGEAGPSLYIPYENLLPLVRQFGGNSDPIADLQDTTNQLLEAQKIVAEASRVLTATVKKGNVSLQGIDPKPIGTAYTFLYAGIPTREKGTGRVGYFNWAGAHTLTDREGNALLDQNGNECKQESRTFFPSFEIVGGTFGAPTGRFDGQLVGPWTSYPLDLLDNGNLMWTLNGVGEKTPETRQFEIFIEMVAPSLWAMMELDDVNWLYELEEIDPAIKDASNVLPVIDKYAMRDRQPFVALLEYTTGAIERQKIKWWDAEIPEDVTNVVIPRLLGAPVVSPVAQTGMSEDDELAVLHIDFADLVQAKIGQPLYSNLAAKYLTNAGKEYMAANVVSIWDDNNWGTDRSMANLDAVQVQLLIDTLFTSSDFVVDDEVVANAEQQSF